MSPKRELLPVGKNDFGTVHQATGFRRFEQIWRECRNGFRQIRGRLGTECHHSDRVAKFHWPAPAQIPTGFEQHAHRTALHCPSFDFAAPILHVDEEVGGPIGDSE